MDGSALQRSRRKHYSLLKCWGREREGSVTPNQLWFIIYASRQQAEVKLIASCTDGPTGNYPIFIFTPIPTQHIEREKTILFVGLSIIVRELLTRVDKRRVYSVFALEELSKTFASLWTEATKIPVLRAPYYEGKISFLTAETFKRNDRPLPPNETCDLRPAVHADREQLAKLCYVYAADSVCTLVLRKLGRSNSQSLIRSEN